MKNIFSTLFVFGSVLVVILLGSFIFDKTGIMSSIHKADKTIEEGLKRVIEDEEEKIEELISDKLKKDNAKDNKSLIAIPDNTKQDKDNKEAAVTKEDNQTKENIDNNTEKDVI